MMVVFRRGSRQGVRMRADSSIPKFITFTAGLLLVILVGCGSQEAGPKASHFEHDHIVAAHWPNDLADAAVKIRERLDWIETGEVPEHDLLDDHPQEHGHDEHHDDHDPEAEIIDLVSWIPEVAADTNLSEANWLPLHHTSESLMTRLRAANAGLSRDDRSQIETLCQMIDETVPKIPKQFATFKGTSP